MTPNLQGLLHGVQHRPMRMLSLVGPGDQVARSGEAGTFHRAPQVLRVGGALRAAERTAWRRPDRHRIRPLRRCPGRTTGSRRVSRAMPPITTRLSVGIIRMLLCACSDCSAASRLRLLFDGPGDGACHHHFRRSTSFIAGSSPQYANQAGPRTVDARIPVNIRCCRCREPAVRAGISSNLHVQGVEKAIESGEGFHDPVRLDDVGIAVAA